MAGSALKRLMAEYKRKFLLGPTVGLRALYYAW